MAQPRLVILGASGFLGRHLLRAASGLEILAVSREPARFSALGGARWIGLESWAEELRRLRGAGPVSVIHAAALTDHAYCERHPEQAMEVNARQVAEAARACRDEAAPFVFVCTDGLFSNRELDRAPRYWSLEDSPDPISAYGRSKLAGERALAGLGWGHSVRMSFVGPSLGTGRGLIAFLAGRLREDAEVPGYTDTWFTPAPAREAACRLVELALEGQGGHSLRQWASAEALSKHDYLEQVARAAGFRPKMVGIRRGELPGAESAQLDQSLRGDDPWSRTELIALGAQALLEELR